MFSANYPEEPAAMPLARSGATISWAQQILDAVSQGRSVRCRICLHPVSADGS